MGWLSSLFSGTKNLLGGAGQALGGAIGNIGKLAAPALKSGTQGLFNSFMPSSQAKQQAPATSPMQIPAYSQLSKQALQNSHYQPSFSGVTNPGFTASTSPDSSPISGKKDDKKNWWENLLGGSSGIFPGGNAQGILGLGIPAIGNMFAPKVKEIPDVSSLSSVHALQNFKPGNSVSPEYQEMLQRNVGRLKDQRTRELQALYRNARPGTDYLTDTNYQRDVAELERGVQEQLSDDLAKAEGQFSSQEQERLSQLAQLDIFQIMQQTGLSAQEADNFKQSFSDVGNMFLTNATRKPQSDLMSLFGGQ